MTQTTSTTEGTTTAAKSTTWNIDASHTNAAFSVRHLMISTVRGEFQKVSGTVTFDPAKPENAKVEATLEVGSISTRDAGRDTHLKSADFFDAEKFPSITFSSTAFRKGDKGTELLGKLTIKDVTRDVVLHVDGPTAEQKDPWGGTRIGASATTKIKRSDFGITWNTALETGGVVVGDEITIQLDVQLVQGK